MVADQSPRGRVAEYRRRARTTATRIAGAALRGVTFPAILLFGMTDVAAADPFIVLQGGGFCSTPFIGQTFSWLTPIATKSVMAIGGLVFLYGILGPASEGRGRLTMGQAIGLGVLMFFVGLQWEPLWAYIGGIYGGGQINAMTCGM